MLGLGVGDLGAEMNELGRAKAYRRTETLLWSAVDMREGNMREYEGPDSDAAS